MRSMPFGRPAGPLLRIALPVENCGVFGEAGWSVAFEFAEPVNPKKDP